MSHFIEDQAVAIRLDMTEKYGDRHAYLLICEGGDNNVTQMVTRNWRQYECRARDWHPVAFAGSTWESMEKIVMRSASCEGGMLHLAGVGRTKPETYIRRWRAAMAEPFALHDVTDAGIAIAARLVVDECTLDARFRETFCGLRDRKPHAVEGTNHRFDFDLASSEDVRTLADVYWIGEDSPFRFFKVRGPREATIRRRAA